SVPKYGSETIYNNIIGRLKAHFRLVASSNHTSRITYIMLSKTVLLSILSTTTLARRLYEDRIPNGDNVPCPPDAEGCVDGLCPEVAYSTCVGGDSPNNQFGLDLQENDYAWTMELCLKDSDGDGFTNGEELGDPCCEWMEGDYPSFANLTELSHPGFSSSVPEILNECAGDAAELVCEDADGNLVEITSDEIVNGTVLDTNGTVLLNETQVASCVPITFESELFPALICTDSEGNNIEIDENDISENGTYVVDGEVILDEAQVIACTPAENDIGVDIAGIVGIDILDEQNLIFCPAFIPTCATDCVNCEITLEVLGVSCAKATCLDEE
ncbi:hypothetical protein SARC_10417, partial [Sphaeroforma arctica JP610]